MLAVLVIAMVIMWFAATLRHMSIATRTMERPLQEHAPRDILDRAA
jgi:ABC-type Fe3+ transport system permease subunit